MFKTIRVRLGERAVIFRNSIPIRALEPGNHIVWGRRLTEQRWQSDELVFAALPEVRALLPAEWFEEVTLATRQRGVLFRDGKPQAFLRPGVHRFWKLDRSVELKVWSVDGPMPELTDELIKLLPAKEYIDKVVQEHERGLQYVQGKLSRVLEPGRYALWSYRERRSRSAPWICGGSRSRLPARSS